MTDLRASIPFLLLLLGACDRRPPSPGGRWVHEPDTALVNLRLQRDQEVERLTGAEREAAERLWQQRILAAKTVRGELAVAADGSYTVRAVDEHGVETNSAGTWLRHDDLTIVFRGGWPGATSDARTGRVQRGDVPAGDTLHVLAPFCDGAYTTSVFRRTREVAR